MKIKLLRRRHPVTRGEKLREVATRIRTQQDLEQALEGFERAERAAIAAALAPYLRLNGENA